MKLINVNSKSEIEIGNKVTTTDGEEVTIIRIDHPRRKGAFGTVCCETANGEIMRWFPSTICAEFVD